ncbi:MAG: hypothetical protein ACT6RD_01330 [Brevundimonas sp.]|uniref:hypothetical protein n=1 Tax=Brevundimonas sp. TaxID=1871086 RepID=UPI0040348CDA
MGSWLGDWLFDFLPGNRPVRPPPRWKSAIKLLVSSLFCLLFVLLLVGTLDGEATFQGVLVTFEEQPRRIIAARILTGAVAGFFAWGGLIHARRLVAPVGTDETA